MNRRKTFDGRFKAMVVFEYIEGKASLNDLAIKYELHPNQIKNWKSLLLQRAHRVLEDRRRMKTASLTHLQPNYLTSEPHTICDSAAADIQDPAQKANI